MSARRSRRSRVLLAVALAGGACAGEPLAQLAARPGPAGEPLRLAEEVRRAVPARPRAPLVLEAEPPHTALRASAAVEEGSPGGAVFHVEAERDGAWQELFREALAPGSGWRDWRIPLSGSGAERFRLRVEPAPGAPGDADPRAHWGSITFLRPRPAPPAPNVILVSLDTLGASYLSAYGNAPGVSPHLDALLEEGHAFHRAIAPYGNTLVSHVSLFSGLQPLRHGVYPTRWATRFPTLVGRFADAGYLTAAFTEGAYVASDFGFAEGFDRYDEGTPLAGAERLGALETLSKAAGWLEGLAPDTRFFLFVQTYEVHSPYLPRDAAARAVARGLTPGVPRRLGEEEQLRRIVRHNADDKRFSERELAHLAALHAAEIHFTDRALRAFLDRLDARGLARDTLLVVTADHGDQFGEHGKVGHGESLHNRVLHVPLVFRWPGRIAPAATDTPVMLVDVLPTLLELAGLEVPPDLDGRSLAPALRGGTLPPRPAFSELRSARGECVQRDLPWNCELGRFAVQSRRFKWVESQRPPEERLHDLEADPAEEVDVSARFPEVAARHRRWLEAYRSRGNHAGEAAPTADAREAPAPLDARTRARLEALGYGG